MLMMLRLRHVIRCTDTHAEAEVDTELGRGLVGGQRVGRTTDGMEGQAIPGGKPYPEHGWKWVPVCTADELDV